MDFNKNRQIWSLWLPLCIGILTYSIGDVLLKVGNYELGSTLVSILQGEFWVALITNYLIISAFVFILASKLVMGYVFAKNPFGLTQGLFLALSVIIAYILGHIIFSEVIVFTDVIAIAAISLGIILVYSSKSYKISSSEK